ncbi:MAG: NAD(P)/FAD-dependent oxidoreductase [Deltaproteobacteria bacterium]|nr:NAD(P)/FAD-dependent oxidoreductase [Deltaproteobacteria bacterium]
MERVLIVGNGYAGLQAARTLSAEQGLAVTMASAEACPAYCPHLLPELAAGRKEAPDLFLSDFTDYGAMGIDFRPGVHVARLSAKKRSALLSNGETVDFDKALVATGSKAHVPENLQGILARCGNVIAMKRMDDALALRRFLVRGASRIAVVGAGRIGVLLAEALRDLHVKVSLVEIGPEILATMLQKDMAARLHPALRERGHIALHTGCRVETASAEGDAAREIALSDGTRIFCDVVVLATGVSPNVGFLEGDFRGSFGLAVDNRMETSEPGIYAAGDVVRFDTITGREDVQPLAMNARIQGEVAARNIAGGKSVCPPSFSGNIVKLGGVIAARIGDIEGDDQADFAIEKSFARVTLSGGTAVGLQLIGNPEDLRGLCVAVLKKFRTGDIRLLLQGNLDLGFAPLLASRSVAWA